MSSPRLPALKFASWAAHGSTTPWPRSRRYVAEGFAELEGEVEAGFLASYAKRRLHLDANVIVSAGFEEGEADGELLVRFGYDVLAPLRLGAESRNGASAWPETRSCLVRAHGTPSPVARSSSAPSTSSWP